jgi:hypothetical protein
VFSIVVFGCISSSGWISDHGQGTVCAFNGVSSACGYGTAIGVLAFLGLMAFLVADAMFDNISNVQHRKYIVIADIGFSGEYLY